DGVVIVDSPGVGESDIMDEIVLNYLPNAFAFIYVINSSNAGGVQTDRWDTIPTQEGIVVMEHINKKLSQCLPDVDINTQIICLSTTKAFAAQKYGVMNSEFASLT
ncbi:unnamed protein product, partial [Pocillopora meandrina]